MDRGIATEERVQWLRDHGYGYLVVSRERIRQFDPDAAQRIDTAQRQGVHLHKVVSEHGHEARLYCFSEERAAKPWRQLHPSTKRPGNVPLTHTCLPPRTPTPSSIGTWPGTIGNLFSRWLLPSASAAQNEVDAHSDG